MPAQAPDFFIKGINHGDFYGAGEIRLLAGFSEGPDVPSLMQNPSPPLKATYNAFVYFILYTGQGLHSACKIFFFFLMVAAGTQTGCLWSLAKEVHWASCSLLPSYGLLRLSAWLRNSKSPLAQTLSQPYQVKHEYPCSTDEEPGLEALSDLPLVARLTPKQVWDWNVCLADTWGLPFHGLLQDLTVRLPHRTVWSQESCFPSYNFCHKERVLYAALNLKRSKFKHLQKVSCGRLERAQEMH